MEIKGFFCFLNVTNALLWRCIAVLYKDRQILYYFTGFMYKSNDISGNSKNRSFCEILEFVLLLFALENIEELFF